METRLQTSRESCDAYGFEPQPKHYRRRRLDILQEPVIEEILVCFPAEALAQSRLVCKQWNQITKTKCFGTKWDEKRITRQESYMVPFIARQHVPEHAVGSSQYFSAVDVNLVSLTAAQRQGDGTSQPCLAFKGQFLPLEFKDSRLVSSAGGLLLFYSRDGIFTMVNPILGKKKVIPRPPILADIIDMVHHGDSYQIIVLRGWKISIYSSSTGTWSYQTTKLRSYSHPAQYSLFFKGMFYTHMGHRCGTDIFPDACFHADECGEISCFDTERKVWRPEMELKVPADMCLRSLSEYNGKILAVVSMVLDRSLCMDGCNERSHRMKKRKFDFMTWNSVEEKWEVLRELPHHLVPEDAVVVDVCGWKNKFVLQLVKPNVDVVESIYFLLYDIDTDEACSPYGQESFSTLGPFEFTPGLTFEPSMVNVP